ncbi:hypothetical protein ACFL3N_01630 [Candidatus Omnitrophota bacterium]
MKRSAKFFMIVLLAACLFGAREAHCADSSSSTDFTISVQNVFSLEFYSDANVLYSTTVPFTNIDPLESIVYPDGRFQDDGKSDTALICRSNVGETWYLKMHSVTTPPLSHDKIKFYMDKPHNRNTGEGADGSLARSPDWYSIGEDATTVYTAGYKDLSNLPFGTLATFNFAIIPTGLEGGKGYSASITYTMTSSS